MRKSRRAEEQEDRFKRPKADSLARSLCLQWVISGWNKAGHWLDSSVHRFKFRLHETRRLVTRPHSPPASNLWKPSLTTLSFLLASQGIRWKGGGGWDAATQHQTGMVHEKVWGFKAPFYCDGFKRKCLLKAVFQDINECLTPVSYVEVSVLSHCKHTSYLQVKTYTVLYSVLVVDHRLHFHCLNYTDRGRLHTANFSLCSL